MKHEHFQEIDSTQDYLGDLNPSHPYLVSCERQTHGKGRHDRKWLQLKDALACSFTLPAHQILTLTALEVAVLINQFFQNRLRLKWPNDLMDNNNQKTGGILIDSKGKSLIVGIGINLNPNQEFGSVYSSHRSFNLKELSFEMYQFIQTHRLNSQKIRDKWMQYCCHANEMVHLDNQPGVFKGIGESGEAILFTQGTLQKFYTGTLRLR